MNLSRMLRYSAVFALSLFANSSAYAIGPDMWNGYNQERNLFTPHANTCNSSTEAFIAVGPNGDGFCFEKAERSSAQWEDARQTCANLNARLPEPGEYKYACTRAGTLGLSDMTNNWEFVSNFPDPFYTDPYQGLDVAILGNGDCYHAALASIGHVSATSVGSLNFRCVH